MEKAPARPMSKAMEHYKESDVCDAAQVISYLPQPLGENPCGMGVLYFILRRVWQDAYNQGYDRACAEEASKIYHSTTE